MTDSAIPVRPEGPSQGRPVAAVDPFLGTDVSALPVPEGVAARWWCAKPPVGNCHPGATLPFGMVSACPTSGCYPSGYGRNAVSLDGSPPKRIFEDYTTTGFAHFQQSGTGRIRMYYNYLSVMPLADGIAAAGRREVLEEEVASPGYYACRLRDSQIRAELSVEEKCVLHRYTFPAGESSPVLALDIAQGGLGIDGMATLPIAAYAKLEAQGHVRGWFRMEGVTVHFYALCEWQSMGEAGEKSDPRPPTTGFWRSGKILPEAVDVDLPRKRSRSEVEPFGACFSAPDSSQEGGEMKLRIGFSLRSGDRARRVVMGQDETAPADFDTARHNAEEAWNTVLDRIRIEGASDEESQTFYTALYHSLLKPGDFFDENPFTKRDGPFYFDFSTMWDMYKCQLPLVMTLFPERGRDIVNFLLDTAAREGNFPISYLMDNVSERFDRQASALAHMTLADAFWRKIEGIDWERGLRAMFRTLKLGRGKQFASKGVTHPLSHTLDLAAANWCTAMIAGRIGEQHIHDACMALEGNWANAYDTSTGLLGDSEFYEGTRWNYSFRLLHNMSGRIALSGGDDGFVRKMDQFFGYTDPGEQRGEFRFEGLNNEPDMESPYAYIYAGRHDRTAEVVRSVIRYQFTTGRGGLPGNDDSGGLSSWYVWSALGLFPVSGQNLMLIGSPVFRRSVMRLPGGDFVVEADNWDEDHTYVAEAWLNDRPIDRAYLHLKEFLHGGHLELRMSSLPSEWARNQRPPSHGG